MTSYPWTNERRILIGFILTSIPHPQLSAVVLKEATPHDRAARRAAGPEYFADARTSVHRPKLRNSPFPAEGGWESAGTVSGFERVMKQTHKGDEIAVLAI